MRNPNSAARAPDTLLLASLVNRSVLLERSPGQPRRIACCPYGSLPGRPRLAFNGEFREPQGWYHLGQGHRLYNPVLRRFNRPDRLSPFGKGGLNAYAYCLGDPVNFSDPTGRIPNFNPAAFLSLVFLENPGANLALTIALLMNNLALAFHATPVGFIAIATYYSGLSGAILGITGSSMQIAGHRNAGRVVSVTGTVFSGLSVASKAITSLNNIRANLPQYMKDLKNRALGTLFPMKWRAAAPVSNPASVPAVQLSPRMTEILNRNLQAPGAIPMTNLSPSVGGAGVSPAGEMREVIGRTASVRRFSLGQTTDDVMEITPL